MGFPGGSDGKESAWNAGDLGSSPWKFLSGASPWTDEPGGLQSMGYKELDTSEKLSTWSKLIFSIPQHSKSM